LVPVTPETLAELQPLAAAASPGHLQSLFEVFLRVETEVRNATFPRMLLELAVLRAVRLEEVQDIATLLGRLEQFESRLAAGGWGSPGPAPAADAPDAGPPQALRPREQPGAPQARETRQPPEPAPSAPTADPEAAVCAPAPGLPAGGDVFARFVERVHREKGMLAGFLEHGRPIKAGDGVFEIGFAPEDGYFLETAREPLNLAYLRTVARDLLGGSTELRLVTLAGDTAGDSPADLRAPRETDLQRRHRQEALNAPALGWATEILQAQVVEVKLDPR
jgi:DNA polymerase-3 subunit gamma/tau